MQTKSGLISGNLEEDNIFRNVFEKIQTAILIIDPLEHIIVDANPLAEFLIGRSRDELIGSPCHEFVCPAKCGECPITDFHKDVRNIERAIINAKGENVPILKTVAKVQIQGKEYLIESFIDIIDRKRSEERKVALLAYLSEALLRVKKPLELMQQDLLQLAGQAKSGDYDTEDIRMQLQINANNLIQIVNNLEVLQKKALEGKESEIPPAFREFIIGK